MLPDAVQVADPFHVVRVANTALDECRRRVQNDTIGHRGRRADPLYRARRLLTMAAERLPDDRRERLVGLLAAGDPKGEVKLTWHANYPALGGGVNDRSVTLSVRGVGGGARAGDHPGVAGGLGGPASLLGVAAEHRDVVELRGDGGDELGVVVKFEQVSQMFA